MKQPGPLCQQCGLWQNKRNPIVEEVRDPRALPMGLPKVLFCMPRPLAEDDKTGILLTDSRTAWFMDFLEQLQCEFRITSLVRCWPGCKPNSTIDDNAKAAHIKACTSTFLVQTIQEFQPTIIVALGSLALEALWPQDRGKCPDIAKARTYPVQLQSGATLVCSYDPMMHVHYLESDGKRGKSLNEEYCRLMTLITQIAYGKYTPDTIQFKLITTQDEMNWLLSRMAAIPLDAPCCPDTETNVYIEAQNRKFRLNSEKVREWETRTGLQLPDKLTIHHPDAKLLLLGWTVWTGTEYETYCIFPDLVQSPDRKAPSTNLILLLRGRYLLPYNGKSDFIDLWVWSRMWVFDRQYGIQWGDGFYMRQLRDQSALDNSLKTSAQILLGTPYWGIQLWQAMEDARAARLKLKEPDYMSMSDVPLVQVLCPYNAYDTREGLRIILEGGMDYPELAYKWLCRYVKFFCTIERNGLPIHYPSLVETIDRKELELETAYQEIRQNPYVQQAEHLSGREFNIRSPFFFQALVGLTECCQWDPGAGKQYPDGPFEGQWIFPEWIPHTPSSKKDNIRLQSDKIVIADLAGETVGKKIPDDEKTPGQCIWADIRDWKRMGDDINKYHLWLEYAVPGEDDPDIYRIHQNFRLGKTEREEVEDVDGDQGGAKSGRTSSKPNTQNIKGDPDFHILIRPPKRKMLAIFDYDRIELVWVGWNCQDQLYMDWARMGLDQHMENAAQIFSFRTGRPQEEFWAYKTREQIAADPEHKAHPEQKIWREFGKTQNFAVVYLIGVHTFCEQNKCSFEVGLAVMEAARTLHPGVVAKMYDLYERLQRGQMSQTYLLERRRSAVGWERDNVPPEVFFSLDPADQKKRNSHNFSIYRSLWNGEVGQTDANDMTSIMGCTALETLESREWLNPEKVAFCNYVHDAIWTEIDEDYIDIAVPEITTFLGRVDLLPKPFGLPVGVTAEVGPSYAEKKVYVVKEKPLDLILKRQ